MLIICLARVLKNLIVLKKIGHRHFISFMIKYTVIYKYFVIVRWMAIKEEDIMKRALDIAKYSYQQEAERNKRIMDKTI